jgi:hypothetical protein
MDQVAGWLGIERRPRREAERVTAELEERLGRVLPGAVRSLLCYDGLVEALARTYEAQPGLLYGRLLSPAEMPGVHGDVLWLMSENQGVCVWGVPLDHGDDPPVLVGGDLCGEETSPAQYADSIETFAFSSAWDQRLLRRTPLVEAGTEPLDPEAEDFLAAQFERRPTTHGWPCRHNLRFDSPTGVCLLLWACARGTDWTISGPDAASVEQCVRDVVPRFDLQPGFGAHDYAGIALLDRVQRCPHWAMTYQKQQGGFQR